MTAEINLDLGREIPDPPPVPDRRGKHGFGIADLGGHLLHRRRLRQVLAEDDARRIASVLRARKGCNMLNFHRSTFVLKKRHIANHGARPLVGDAASTGLIAALLNKKSPPARRERLAMTCEPPLRVWCLSHISLERDALPAAGPSVNEAAGHGRSTQKVCAFFPCDVQGNASGASHAPSPTSAHSAGRG